MFGDMVFDMTRSFNGVQFILREHIDRIYAGVKMLKIPLEMTPDQMEQAVHETIEANKPAFDDNDEHRIMIDVTRGPLSMYAHASAAKAE
jgi:branched-chain amino acid aminotransferase